MILRHSAQLKQKSVNLQYDLHQLPLVRPSSHIESPTETISTGVCELKHKSVAFLASAVQTFISRTDCDIDAAEIKPALLTSGTYPLHGVENPTSSEYVRDTLAKCLHFATEKSYCQRPLDNDRNTACKKQALKLFVSEMFKFTQYKRDNFADWGRGQIMRGAMGSLARLRHSCNPNAVVTYVFLSVML